MELKYYFCCRFEITHILLLVFFEIQSKVDHEPKTILNNNKVCNDDHRVVVVLIVVVFVLDVINLEEADVHLLHF
jgi:hypothetical protein